MDIKSNQDALNLLFDQKIYVVKDKEIGVAEPNQEVQEKELTATPVHSKPEEQNLPKTESIKTDKVTLTEKSEPESKAEPVDNLSPIPFLGNNKKKVWMIFNGSSISDMPREQKITFLNILKSIGLEFSDIACTGIEEFEAGNLNNLHQRIEFKHLILWGVEEPKLELNTSLYQLSIEDETTIINLPKFEDVFSKTEIKRKVWDCIKNFSA